MPGEETEPPLYEILLRRRDRAELRSWNEREREVTLAFLRDYASRTPTAPIPGRLKQLNAPFEDHYQLRVSRRRRLIYRVDEERRRVRVVYLGPHPDWRQSRPGSITR